MALDVIEPDFAFHISRTLSNMSLHDFSIIRLTFPNQRESSNPTFLKMAPGNRQDYGVCYAAIDELLALGEQLPETKERAIKLRQELYGFLGMYPAME